MHMHNPDPNPNTPTPRPAPHLPRNPLRNSHTAMRPQLAAHTQRNRPLPLSPLPLPPALPPPKLEQLVHGLRDRFACARVGQHVGLHGAAYAGVQRADLTRGWGEVRRVNGVEMRRAGGEVGAQEGRVVRGGGGAAQRVGEDVDCWFVGAAGGTRQDWFGAEGVEGGLSRGFCASSRGLRGCVRSVQVGKAAFAGGMGGGGWSVEVWMAAFARVVRSR